MMGCLQSRKKNHQYSLKVLCCILLITAGLLCLDACGRNEDAKPPIDKPVSNSDSLQYTNTHIPDYNSPDNAFLSIQNISLPQEETLEIFSRVTRDIWNQNQIDIYLQNVSITSDEIQKNFQYRYYLSPRIDHATNSVEHIKTARLYMFYLLISGENLLRKGEHWAGLDRLTAASVLAGMVAEHPSCLMELLMAYANLKSISDFLLHLKKSDLLSNHDLMLLFDTRKIVYRTPEALYSALSGDKLAILSLIIAVKNDILPEKKLNLLLGEHYPELYQDMKHVNHVNIDTVLNAELTRLLQACTQGKSYEADLTAYPFLNLSEENVLRYFLTPYQHLLPQIQKIFHQLLILSDSNMLVPVQKQNENNHADIRQQ